MNIQYNLELIKVVQDTQLAQGKRVPQLFKLSMIRNQFSRQLWRYSNGFLKNTVQQSVICWATLQMKLNLMSLAPEPVKTSSWWHSDTASWKKAFFRRKTPSWQLTSLAPRTFEGSNSIFAWTWSWVVESWSQTFWPRMWWKGRRREVSRGDSFHGVKHHPLHKTKPFWKQV